MKKRAFTLVELLISVFLLGLIVNFLYSAISNLQKTNNLFNQKSNELQNDQKLLDLLYDDIFLAEKLNIAGVKNSNLNLLTSNSIFDIQQPYVTWLISKEKQTLLRFESTKSFSTMNADNTNLFHISKAGEGCERFKIYQSKDKNNILIHIKFKDKEPLVYEFFKPMQIKDNNESNESNKTKPNLPKKQS